MKITQTRLPAQLSPLIVLGSLLAWTVAVADESAVSADARVLVGTMGLERSALLGVRLSVEDGVKNGNANSALLKCAENLDSSTFVELFAGELQTALSPIEMKSAQAFYASPAGQKSVEAGLQQMYRLAGRPPPGGELTFTAAEARENEAFARTSAGEKLIAKQILGTPRVANAIQDLIGKLMSACMRGRK